jgi:hypothetical protein
MASLPSHLPSTFTLSQALAAGATKKVLYRLRDRGELEVLARGVFRRSESRYGQELWIRNLIKRRPLSDEHASWSYS